eukprot:g4195.t1
MKTAKKARLVDEDRARFDNDHLDKTLTAVSDVQGQLDKLADEMSERGLQMILQLNEQYSNLRAPYYASRKALIHSIPGFWKTVFLNHPVLASLLTADDEEILDYIEEMEVKEFEDHRGGFTLEFGFSSNPYFSNEKLIKIVRYDDGGCMVVDGTPPAWREGMEPIDVNEEVNSEQKRKQEKIYNLFMWFGESGTMENGQQDELSLLIRDDIWPNPLKYYKIESKAEDKVPSAARRSRRRPRRDSKTKEEGSDKVVNQAPSNVKQQA